MGISLENYRATIGLFANSHRSKLPKLNQDRKHSKLKVSIKLIFFIGIFFNLFGYFTKVNRTEIIYEN